MSEVLPLCFKTYLPKSPPKNAQVPLCDGVALLANVEQQHYQERWLQSFSAYNVLILDIKEVTD